MQSEGHLETKRDNVLLSKLVKDIGVNILVIRKTIIQHKIEVVTCYGMDKHEGVSAEDADFILSLDLKHKKCGNPKCKKKFELGHYSTKYCSEECRTQKNQDDSRKGKANIGRGKAIKDGRENMKKMQECTIDCLLDEFGDLE